VVFRDHRGVYTIQTLEQMLHEKSWGRILANLGRIDLKKIFNLY